MRWLALLLLAARSWGACFPALDELARYEVNGDLTDCLGRAAAASSTGSFSYVTTGAIEGTAIGPTVAGSGAHIDPPNTLLTSTAGTVSWYAYASTDVAATQCMWWGGSSSQTSSIANEYVISSTLLRADLNGTTACNGVTPTVSTATRYAFLVTWSEAQSKTQWYIGTATSDGGVASLTLVCTGANTRLDTVNANRFFNGFNDLDKWNNTTGFDRIRYFSRFMTQGEALASFVLPTGEGRTSIFMENSNDIRMVPD